MNQRGEYGHSRRTNGRSHYGSPGWQAWCAYVGADPFDADRAFKQIDVEMEAVVDATYQAMGVDPATIRKPTTADAAWQQRVLAAKTKAQQSPLWSFWESSVSPKYEDWRSTRAGFVSKPMAIEEYERWLGRVGQLRAEVKAKGIQLKTPDPVSLTAVPEPAADMGKFLKWGAIGALALGGVALVAVLASSTKQERAPYERYRYGYPLAR